jgi:copper homeostasis protein
MSNQITHLEICIDNIESLDTLNKIGVDRIELCSSLALGGLSPTLSLLEYSSKNTDIPIHAMVRPRPGGFNYSESEIDACLEEIKLMKPFNISGIVFGALTENNEINLNACSKICKIANELNFSITFHRAIDMVKNYEKSIEQLIELGFTRILTSGHTDNVLKGINKLTKTQAKYGHKIQIMAGGGVKLNNIELLLESGIKHIHSSASKIKKDTTSYTLGKNAGDLSYQITDIELLKTIKSKVD